MPRVAEVLSERVWPVARVAVLQIVLMTGIAGNLAGWLVLSLLVDRLGWLRIDFHGKTLSTISPDGKVLGMLILFLVNLGLVLLAWRWLERKRPADLLWTFSRGGWRPLVWGIGAGLAETAIVFCALAALGVARPVWGLRIPPARTAILALGWIAASAVFGPVVEEVLNRGYWFQNIRRGWGSGAAIIVTSMLFGGLHLLNPNAEVLGAVNIALSAAAWAIGMLWTGSLWFPIGWHAAWNFAQFFIAGLPNSGFSPTAMGLSGATAFVTDLRGPRWLTGAAFGMEASVVKTAFLACAVAVLWRIGRRARAARREA